MKIELQNIKVSDLVDGYADNQEGGVVGYHGLLNIRPKYQREFIYSQAQAAAVIQTVMNGFPLNTMYWIALSDGNYEVMDGQQRTLSICQYISGDFSVDFGDSNPKNFFNLKNDEKDRILNYCLTVYITYLAGRHKKARKSGQVVTLRLPGCRVSRDRAGCGSRWTAGAPPYPRAGCRSWRHVRGLPALSRTARPRCCRRPPVCHCA